MESFNKVGLTFCCGPRFDHRSSWMQSDAGHGNQCCRASSVDKGRDEVSSVTYWKQRDPLHENGRHLWICSSSITLGMITNVSDDSIRFMFAFWWPGFVPTAASCCTRTAQQGADATFCQRHQIQFFLRWWQWVRVWLQSAPIRQMLTASAELFFYNAKKLPTRTQQFWLLQAGGWYSYRASKTAMNAGLPFFGVTWKGNWEGAKNWGSWAIYFSLTFYCTEPTDVGQLPCDIAVVCPWGLHEEPLNRRWSTSSFCIHVARPKTCGNSNTHGMTMSHFTIFAH